MIYMYECHKKKIYHMRFNLSDLHLKIFLQVKKQKSKTKKALN